MNTIEAMKQALAAISNGPYNEVQICRGILSGAIAREEAQTEESGYFMTERQMMDMTSSICTLLAVANYDQCESFALGVLRSLPKKRIPPRAKHQANCVSYPGNYEVTPGQAVRITRTIEADAPPQRRPMTNGEIEQFWLNDLEFRDGQPGWMVFARAIEGYHGITGAKP